MAQVNPQINAWTQITERRMLAEADQIDALRRTVSRYRRWRGPYAVKNLFDVAGETTLAGAQLFSDRPPAVNDGWAVRQICAAGGLLSGMVNMDAYAYGFTTENSHYGATHNPHDLQRIAGGSSGGSAAAVAAGLVHFSLGSDTNGSIRVPASLCGIFGLKPTFGRLSRAGSHPFVASLDHIGPFARCVDDLAAVYDALQGTTPTMMPRRTAVAPTRQRLERGAEDLRCACWAAISATGAIATPVPPWHAWRRPLRPAKSMCSPRRSLPVRRRLSSAPPKGAITICRRCGVNRHALNRTRGSVCWPGR
jgi:aspartyl-tRNA(Asn)/glutamyl-tRNA(Gln) amidotransferase subunit A